jgi:hypothetical protein
MPHHWCDLNFKLAAIPASGWIRSVTHGMLAAGDGETNG